jgi:putative PIN family toxin of toxin-antitoxin system
MSPAQRPPRVVIGTNLVLSALVFSDGRLNVLRHAWQKQVCIPLVSKLTASEIIRVLAYPKFKLTADEQHELLADYLPYCETVVLRGNAPETLQCRDVHDIPFLHLAQAAKADCLVTGDDDLLSLAAVFTCPIVTAQDFIVRYSL